MERLPNFVSEKEKQQYLGAVFSNSKEDASVSPVISGGKAIRVSSPEQAIGLLDAGIIPTLAGSHPGYDAIRDELDEKGIADIKERMVMVHDANEEAIKEDIRRVRERHPYAPLFVNVMRAVSDYKRMIQTIGELSEDPSGEFIVDGFFVGAGLPEDLPETIQKYPRMRYIPILSNVRAAKVYNKRSVAKEGRIPPHGVYVEQPWTAGGHLGERELEKALEKMDPVEIREGMEAIFPDSVFFLGGGLVYNEDIVQAVSEYGYRAGVMGTRTAVLRESGIPDRILRDFYLNPDLKVEKGKISPTDFPSSEIGTEELRERLIRQRLPEEGEKISEVRKDIMRRCVRCIGDVCLFMKHKKELCIAEALSDLLRGKVDSIMFAGSELDTIKHDPLYHNDNGIYVPNAVEMADFLFNPENKRPLAA